MRILYYTWFENSSQDIAETFVFLGHELIKCNIPFQDYEQDESFARQIKYISWIYDCPHWTLYSPAVKSVYNYIFVFDSVQFIQLKSLDLPHLHHFPLAVNTRRLCQDMGEPRPESGTKGKERLEVSFVGSLYENNRFDQILYLPEYIRGYLEGIIQAQGLIYGYNFVQELLTEDVVRQMNEHITMKLPESYMTSQTELYAAMLNEKITCQERVSSLNLLSRNSQLTVYTASDLSLVPAAAGGGTVDYQREMPEVFRHSKINLNITLRSIQSGIPLRALDIMGAGGFLLSNYQQELAEQFEDGKELALYASAEELVEKSRYYLLHEEERREIAYHGYLKVQRLFSYEVRVKQMLELVEKGM